MLLFIPCWIRKHMIWCFALFHYENTDVQVLRFYFIYLGRDEIWHYWCIILNAYRGEVWEEESLLHSRPDGQWDDEYLVGFPQVHEGGNQQGQPAFFLLVLFASLITLAEPGKNLTSLIFILLTKILLLGMHEGLGISDRKEWIYVKAIPGYTFFS